MLNDILILVSVLLMMVMLKGIIRLFPYLIACISRSKENINLENNVKLSRTRDFTAIAMILPFCLLVYNYHIYGNGIIDSVDDNLQILMILGILLAYILFRKIVYNLFRTSKIPKYIYIAAEKSSYTFFILLNIALFFLSGVMSIADTDPAIIKTAMLWISAVTYIGFIIRKTEIFLSGCSVFTAFLYLCALEIIPTGTLMVSLIIF